MAFSPCVSPWIISPFTAIFRPICRELWLTRFFPNFQGAEILLCGERRVGEAAIGHWPGRNAIRKIWKAKNDRPFPEQWWPVRRVWWKDELKYVESWNHRISVIPSATDNTAPFVCSQSHFRDCLDHGLCQHRQYIRCDRSDVEREWGTIEHGRKVRAVRRSAGNLYRADRVPPDSSDRAHRKRGACAHHTEA